MKPRQEHQRRTRNPAGLKWTRFSGPVRFRAARAEPQSSLTAVRGQQGLLPVLGGHTNNDSGEGAAISSRAVGSAPAGMGF